MRMLSKGITAPLIVPFVTLLLAGCAVGPDFTAPDAPNVKKYSPAVKADTISGPTLKRGEHVSEQWWRIYGSKALNELISQGMQQSPTLAAASATLRASQEDYASQSGTILYPVVDGSVKSTRQKISGSSFGQGGDFIYSLHTASVSVSYAFDPFGSGRRYLESLRALVDYQGFQLEAARQTLAANIVTTVINQASLRGQLAAQQEVVDSRKAALKIVARQVELGVVTEAEVLSQRTVLAQARTTLPPLEKQLAQQQHQLSVLVGRMPGQGSSPAFELAGLLQPASLPLSLPSELVQQRPDIRAAEAQLHQANALVGLATANMYPSLTITAGFGRQAVQFSDLLNGPASGIWNIGGNLLQPLFHGGELTAKRRQALASLDAARAQYRLTVLQAFRDVADVLLALQSDGRGLKLQQHAESLAQQTLDLVQQQFDLGAVSFLTLLSAQQQYALSHVGVVQAQAMLLADTTALFQAMGGGWWQRSDAYRPVAGNADFFKSWSGATQADGHKSDQAQQNLTFQQIDQSEEQSTEQSTEPTERK